MAVLHILRYPDPRLHTVARPVAVVDERIRRLVDDMLETMYAAEGVGLAATQVDVHERVVVIDVSEKRDEPRVLINPELLWVSEAMADGEEGCLSVPQTYDRVRRHAQVRVAALQHEMDHLMGKVFVEYLSPLKRDRIKTKLLKRQRDEQSHGARGRL